MQADQVVNLAKCASSFGGENTLDTELGLQMLRRHLTAGTTELQGPLQVEQLSHPLVHMPLRVFNVLCFRDVETNALPPEHPHSTLAQTTKSFGSTRVSAGVASRRGICGTNAVDKSVQIVVQGHWSCSGRWT